MKILHLKVKNYKMFKDLDVKNIPNFAVFIGANGTGKSSLFDVFGFLHDCLTTDVRQALDKRGRFERVVSYGTNNEAIEIEIKFREKDEKNKSPIITYILKINEENGQAYIEQEILKHRRGMEHGKPFHFLDFSNGIGKAIINEKDTNIASKPNLSEYTLSNNYTLAVKGLSIFEQFNAGVALKKLLESWRISDFHINEARGSKSLNMPSEHLSKFGDNLPLVARYYHDNYPIIFAQIIDKMKSRITGIDSIESKLQEDGTLLLRFKEKAFNRPFIDRFVSDGTIKMFAYLILLYDPKPHPLLCIEEPENQLYSELMPIIAEEFRQYSERGGQVFASTHSPDFLNGCKVDEVFWLEKKNGFSKIHRASDNAQVKKYMENGDKMGYLWREGWFNGVSPL